MTLVSKALVLGVALSVGSCSAASKGTGTPTPEKTGEVGLNLTFSGGETVPSLAYTLTNGTPADTLTGTIPITGTVSGTSFVVPTFEILPVPAASGYSITLTGSSADGRVTCTGSDPATLPISASNPGFSVTAGNETVANVLVTCTTTGQSGSVEVNATIQSCPTISTLTAINATASTAAPGNTSTIYASAVAPNPATLTYTFSITSGTGTLSGQTAASNAVGTSSSILFTCPLIAEVDTIQVVSADQTGATCPASLTTAAIPVTCTSPACTGVGTGIEATPDTAAGTCPAGQSNTLLDSHGNFCCAPTPCFGIGTGTEAIPDTAAGICPAGSANTGSLQDAQGNFCCSTSATVAYSVVRVGALGATTQGTDGTATAAFVENHALNLSTNADTPGTTIALPTTLSGAQQPFAYQSIAGVGGPNDGALSLSADGHFLTLAGYDAAVGTAGSVVTNADARVIARINAAGTVDTSTFFAAAGAYVSGFIRSSATVNGSAFWTSGNDSTTGGIWYIPFGTAGGGTQLTANCPTPTCNPAVTPPAVRVVNVFDGQLYGTADNSATTMNPVLFTAGTGEPTSASIALTGLSGFPTVATTGADDISPWAFTFVGTNTVYIASDQAVSTGAPPNGVEKWMLSGGTWSMVTTFNLATGQVTAGQVGFRGLAVLATGGGTTTFIASTVEPGSPVPGNHLAIFVDTGVYGTGGMTPTGTVVVQAPTNTLYKGIALQPH